MSNFAPGEMDKPAILGGEPLLKEFLPITRPYLPSYETLEADIKKMMASGLITNDKYVKKFEETARNFLGAQHIVAVSSCTSGLILAERALRLKGEIILPSLTFFATGHSLLWNNLTPVFVDVDPETFLIDPEKVNEAMTSKTSAILGVHTYGCPAPAKELEQIAHDQHITLLFDAAHAFGAKIGNKNVGTFGDIEVFSCSPTKVMVTGEGGVCATPHEDLKKKLMAGRNYGDDGTYDCDLLGLNARMPEFNAILGIQSIHLTNENIEKREKIYTIYRKGLSKIPGITFQKFPQNVKVTHKDTPLLIDPHTFGMHRDVLLSALEKENIMTKKYFFPPLHRQKLYKEYFPLYDKKLPHTNHISENILSIPLYSSMSEEQAHAVVHSIERLFEHREKVAPK